MSSKRGSSQEERVTPSMPSNAFDLGHVQRAVQGIRYGEVRVIIQDGVIVQIERVEKQRVR